MLTARPGFGLLGAVVVLALVAIMGALAVTPNLAQARDQWRIERTIDRLEWLTDGPTALFRFNDDVGRYPGALQHLSRAITNTDLNLCGGTYTGGQVGNWGGRYSGRIHLATGTPLPIGLLADTLEYAGGVMTLVIRDVPEEQARHMDRRVDGVADGAAGRVRYGAPDANGLVTVRWRTTTGSC
jgi:hypothetical protein